jgi:hypothetical protein
MYTRFRSALSRFSFAAALAIAGYGQASAQGTDLERLARCDRDLCDMIRAPNAAGKALECDLGMTWYKEQIEKVAKDKGLPWMLGDASCKMKLDVSRAVITEPLAKGDHRMKVPEQTATCEVEYKGSRYPVKVSVAPEIAFKNGKATEVNLGVKDIEANMIVKALVWSAAKVQEKTGAYQADFVKGVNTYIEKECRGRAKGKRQVELD